MNPLLSAFLIFSILFYSGISSGESQNEGAISWSKNYTFRFIDLPGGFHTIVQITRKTEQPTLISVPCLNITKQSVTSTYNLTRRNCSTVEIFSTADITVHGIVHWNGSTPPQGITAGFLALPHDQLGTEYLIDCYTPTNGTAQVAISAISNTTIDITCISACIFKGKNVSIPIVLQAGESGILTNLKNNTEMSGTYIRSDKPISVLVGATGVHIPEVGDAHWVILEQLLPVSSWGKVHIVPSFQKLPDSWIIRIMAMNSNTTTRLQNCGNEESNPMIILKSTSFKDIMVNGSASGFLCVVTANQTIQVMQYVARSSNQKYGDPRMTIVPPLKDLMDGNTTMRVSDKDDQFKDYADIIVLEQGKVFLQVNGSTLLDRPWSCVNVTSPASEGSESATEYGEFCHYWMELQSGEYKFTHTNRSAKFWVGLNTLHNSLSAAMMADIAPEENEGASSCSKRYTFRFIDLPADFHTIVQITRKTEQQTLISVPCLNIAEQPITNTSDLPVQNCQTVEIFSTADITVHGIVHWRKNITPQGITAGFLALPHDQLGTEYVIDCYTPTNGKAQVAISAISNDTTINITCKSACLFEGKNVSNSIVLQAGKSGILEALKNGFEMSGTYIRSDEPISVLVGAMGVHIPKVVVGSHGVILEQLLPVSSWGKLHIIPPFQESPDGWIIRIMAMNSSTTIWLQKCGNEESESIILNSTSFKDIMVSGSAKEFLCVVTADQPIQVMQYVASSSDKQLGDPSMTIVPPLKYYHGNTTIRVNETDEPFKDYADVIVSEQGKQFIQVNGSTLLDRPWSCVNVTSPASEGSESAKEYGEFCHYWMELQSGEHKFTYTGRSAKFWVRLYTLHNSLGAAMMADIAREATLPVDETTKTRESEEELKKKVTELEDEFPGDFPSYKVAKEVLNNFTLFLGDRGKLGSVNETDIAFEYFYDVLIRRPLSNATADEAMSFLNKTSEALQVLYSEKTKGHLTKACEDGKNLSSSGEDIHEKLEELLTNASALIVGGGVSSFEVSRKNAAFNILSTNNALTSEASMPVECEGDIQIGGSDVTIPCEVVQEMGSQAVYQMMLPYGGDVIASAKCGDEKKLGSALYSIGLVSNQPHRNFSENVTLSFDTRSLEDEFIENNTLCAFWNYETSNWSTDGCTPSLDNVTGETRVTCLCNHLTSFAVLLDLSGEIDEVNKKILDQLTWIGCCFSIVACFLTCFGYAILRLRSDRILVHGNLALAVGLAETAFLCLDAIPEPSEKPILCLVLACFIYYHFMAMFAWMAIEGIHLYLMIFVVWNAEKRKIKEYMACGWGIPVIFAIVMVVLFTVNEGSERVFAFDEYCFLSMADKSLLLFAVPVAVVIVFNIFLTIRVIIQIVKMSDGPTMKSDIKTRAKHGVKAMAVLLPIMGLTWIVGFLALEEAKLVFSYTFVVLNSLQGVFIFVIHFFRNSEVRKAFQRQRQRWAASSTWNGESSSSKNTRRKSSSSGAGKNFEPPMQTVTMSNMSSTKTKIF